ncbi:hypothetical protein ACEPAG_8187 [Sanghuangporus baumii]
MSNSKRPRKPLPDLPNPISEPPRPSVRPLPIPPIPDPNPPRPLPNPSVVRPLPVPPAPKETKPVPNPPDPAPNAPRPLPVPPNKSNYHSNSTHDGAHGGTGVRASRTKGHR